MKPILPSVVCLQMSALAVVATCGLSRALANPPARVNDDAGAAARFEQADTDHDGRISRQEFLAGVKNKVNWWPHGQDKPNTGQNAASPEMFTALDLNRDGYLSKEEIENGRPLRGDRGYNTTSGGGTREGQSEGPRANATAKDSKDSGSK